MSKVVTCFFLSFLSCAVICYDITSHGSLESSHTGRYLKDFGLLVYIKPYYSVIEEQTILLYKWGKQNFPYNEYDTIKNKTVEISNDVNNKIKYWTLESIKTIEKYSGISKNWIVENTKSEFWQKIFKYCENAKNRFFHLCSSIIKYSVKIWKNIIWAIQNISRDTFTWNNIEKSYFVLADQIKIYYSDIVSYIGRKINGLLSA